jgi:hypothetical protein
MRFRAPRPKASHRRKLQPTKAEFAMSALKKANPLDPELPLWLGEDGSPLSCTEKIKVLNENYHELRQMVRDMLEDGVLMGGSEEHLRKVIINLVETVRLDF